MYVLFFILFINQKKKTKEIRKCEKIVSETRNKTFLPSE